MRAMRIRIQEYIREDGSNPYKSWFDGLDPQAAAKVAVATLRLEMGNTSNVKWFEGIGEAKEGNRLHDISHAIQSYVEKAGFSVVREFVGHGIGRSLHEEPQIPNYGEKGTGIRLKKGMVFAIEPMVNMGKSDVMIKDNGWTAITKDGSLSAHFEHTVAITENGADILSSL